MTTDIVKALASYNTWANAQTRAECAKLSEEQLKKNVGAFFGSIHGTLNHVMVADRIWMARFLGEAEFQSPLDAILHGDSVQFWEERAAFDARIEAFAAGVTADWLAGTLTFGRVSSPVKRTRPRWALVVHMFNHATYHRGQVTTLMKQMGFDPAETDFPAAPVFGSN
jgi:uncharacterized damage-inducible protein DinB